MRNKTRYFLLALAAGLVGAGWTHAQPRLLAPAAPYVETAPLPNSVEFEHETYYAPDINRVQPIQEYTEGIPVTIHNNVTYRAGRKVPACAVPYLVEVPLPPSCNSCAPCSALVKICVPPCTEPCVRVRRDGYTLLYDFEGYVVKVAVRRDGHVIVRYKA